MKPILYTTDCPKCKILENKLNKAGIEFDVCKDVKKMRSMKMLSAPNLQIDETTILDFYKAQDWVENHED